MVMRFPTATIRPVEDPSEHATHTIIDAAVDLRLAVADALTVDCTMQIRRRVGACVAVLMDVENAALKKMDGLE